MYEWDTQDFLIFVTVVIVVIFALAYLLLNATYFNNCVLIFGITFVTLFLLLVVLLISQWKDQWVGIGVGLGFLLGTAFLCIGLGVLVN